MKEMMCSADCPIYPVISVMQPLPFPLHVALVSTMFLPVIPRKVLKYGL